MVTIEQAFPTAADRVAAAFDWWRDAGVDADFADAAQDWLAAPPLPAPAAATAAAPVPLAAPVQAALPPPRLGGDAAHWPQDLAGFGHWWLSAPELDGGTTTGRVAPRGPHGAPLAILVEHPEAADTDRLLSGPHGRLIGALLRALGHDEDAVYVAAALPRHMPLPDWSALDAAGLGDIARHHLALAAPQRLITFGPNVSSLLGHAPANSGAHSPPYYRIGASLPALAAPALESLQRPGPKRLLWQTLLRWPQD